MASAFACPTCGSDRHTRWTWRTGVVLHWMVNPGLIVNEILLGQRVPVTIAFCESCDQPRVKRQYVQCTGCGKWHPGGLWSGRLGFGNWFGLVCPDCGATIPSFRNVPALLLTILAAPVWWPASSILRKRHRDWNRRRLASAAGRPAQATPPGRHGWLALGVLAWGPLTWALFSITMAILAGVLGKGSVQIVLVVCLVSLPLWLGAGALWGYSMNRWSSEPPKEGRRVKSGRFEAAVELDDRDGTLTATYPDGSVQAISWDALERVEIYTNDSGPWGADVWWVLTAGNSRCAYPQGATGEAELIPKLQRLPGFDNKALIDAMGCTGNRVFVCWTR